VKTASQGSVSSFQVRLTPSSPEIARAPGGIAPGSIGGELNTGFRNLGTAKEVKSATLTFPLTHHDAALTPAPRELGEKKGESRDAHQRPHP